MSPIEGAGGSDPWRGLEEVELSTLEWVGWFNN
jgi:hypothetical protein